MKKETVNVTTNTMTGVVGTVITYCWCIILACMYVHMYSSRCRNLLYCIVVYVTQSLGYVHASTHICTYTYMNTVRMYPATLQLTTCIGLASFSFGKIYTCCNSSFHTPEHVQYTHIRKYVYKHTQTVHQLLLTLSL